MEILDFLLDYIYYYQLGDVRELLGVELVQFTVTVNIQKILTYSYTPIIKMNIQNISQGKADIKYSETKVPPLLSFSEKEKM